MLIVFLKENLSRTGYGRSKDNTEGNNGKKGKKNMRDDWKSLKGMYYFMFN